MEYHNDDEIDVDYDDDGERDLYFLWFLEVKVC